MGRDFCNEKDPTNKRILNFIKKHLTEAQEIANGLGVSAEWILGLSGTESSYGTSKFAREANNYFGIHPNAPGSIGNYPSGKKAKVSKFTSFKSSAKSFVTLFGNLVRNTKTEKDFVNALVPKFNPAVSPDGNPNFKQDTLDGITAISRRMSCDIADKPAHKSYIPHICTR